MSSACSLLQGDELSSLTGSHLAVLFLLVSNMINKLYTADTMISPDKIEQTNTLFRNNFLCFLTGPCEQRRFN